MPFRQVFPETPHVGPLPFRFEVREMAQYANDVGSSSYGGVGDRHTIRRGAVPYLLLWFPTFAGRSPREWSDESVSAAMASFDKARLLRIVLERSAQLLNARRKCIVTHRRAAPDCGEQIRLGDRLSGVQHELFQHLGGLRRQPDLARAGPQTSGRGLESIAAEADALFVHIRSAKPAFSAGCWRYGPGTSPHMRGVGKTFPGLQMAAGSNACRSSCIVSRSASENIFAIDVDLSAPTPCSPVIEPPASIQYMRISDATFSASSPWPGTCSS